jgi:hypothetical protein
MPTLLLQEGFKFFFYAFEYNSLKNEQTQRIGFRDNLLYAMFVALILKLCKRSNQIELSLFFRLFLFFLLQFRL